MACLGFFALVPGCIDSGIDGKAAPSLSTPQNTIQDLQVINETWELLASANSGTANLALPNWGRTVHLRNADEVRARIDWTCTIPDCKMNLALLPADRENAHRVLGKSPLYLNVTDPVDGQWQVAVTFPQQAPSFGVKVNGTLVVNVVSPVRVVASQS